MFTQTYDVESKAIIDVSSFGNKGRVIVTYIPEGEELYLESDEYLNDPVVFSGNDQEAIDFLSSRIKTHAHRAKEKVY